MTDRLIALDPDDAFARAYPDMPAPLRHRLQHHPLFARDALAALAARLPARQIEHSLGTLAVDQDPAAVPRSALDPVAIVRSIDDNGCWMVMKHVDRDPAYAALTDALLAGIEDVVAPATGGYRRREAFLFLSAPGSVTPFHMDPEHNILLQIEGAKTMRVYPRDDRAIVSQRDHEAFHRGRRHRNMRFDPAFDADARAFALGPGDAVYVPVKAPHWVANGDAPSISFSITWRSDASDGEARVHRVNSRLRALGLSPRPPGEAARIDAAKIAAHRGTKAATAVLRRLAGRPPRERAAY